MLGRRGIGGLVLVAGLALAGCGGGGGPHEEVVIRTGSAPITNATIAHWMSAMSPQHVLPIPPHFTACKSRLREAKPQSSDAELEKECARRYVAVRGQALAFLISSHWLTGEAREEGMGISPAEVTKALHGKEASFPGGKAEFEESQKVIGHSIEDARFELEAELASTKLRTRVLAGVPRITAPDVADFYRKNIGKYRVPEQRHFTFAENLLNRQVAEKFKREAETSRPRKSLKEVHRQSLIEVFPRRPYSVYIGEKRRIIEDIFKAKPHVITEPIELNHLYFLVEVTRITPPYLQTFASVRAAIARKLTSERHRRALASFVASWRKKWAARTDCHRGYVVQKCRQFDGVKTAEEPLALN